jgi:hypothetical protein
MRNKYESMVGKLEAKRPERPKWKDNLWRKMDP